MKSQRSFEEYLDVWLTASLDVRALVVGLTPEQLALPTGCTAWNVQDVFAHIIDIECLMSGKPAMNHTPDWDSLPELGRSGRVTEIGVDGRRGRTFGELLIEFDEIIAIRKAQLSSGSHDLTSLVKGPTGTEWSTQKSFDMRINDTWVHGQDIRAALDQPGDLDSQAAQISALSLFEMLPFAWAKSVQAPVGSVLEIHIASPFDLSTQVTIYEDGRAGICTGQTPTVLVKGDWGVLLPLLTGRSNDSSLKSQLRITGDDELAGRLLAHMAITS
jgi:uncharacterized protein (TIGR03083 family)